jgi:PAS domain S-box-containing protein
MSPPSAISLAPPPPVWAEVLEPWAGSLELAVLFDPAGRLLAVNRAFARKFGQPEQTWAGRSLASLVHPDDAEDWADSTPRLRRAPHHISREHRWQTAQGWRWLAWEETARRGPAGEMVAVRAIGRDVTRHRLSEEHFRKIAQAVEQAPVSIVMTTPGGVAQYVNSRFTEVTGYTLEEIFERGIPVLREGHASEAAYRQFCAVVAGGHKWTGELHTRGKHGREVWELVSVSPIRNHLDEITHLLSLREDITERKTLEDQLRQAQKMESIGTLAGGIAHDFNNIIAIIRGFTELSLTIAPADPRLVRYLGSVHDAALRASGLVGQILTFSRKNEVAYRAVRLDEIINELMGMFAETFPRSIELRKNLDSSIEAFSVDPNQIRQVLVNLCVNARDAMPDGGVITLSTRRVPGSQLVALKGDPAQEYACISLADNGPGMTAEVRARIFEPFFTTKQGSGGTGLGLAVVYGVVTNHHGLLDLETAQGQGATFHIYLPLKTRQDDVPALYGHGREARLAPGRERVLLVEDEVALLELLETVLQNAGYEVLAAANGTEAVERIQTFGRRLDAVVLDLNMPRLGGIEVLKFIRQQQLGLPVLVTSGHLTPEVKAELKELGQVHVLEKPFELSVFGEMLRDAVGSRKTR